MAQITLSLDTNAAAHTIRITLSTNGNFRAHASVIAPKRGVVLPPPMPPQLNGVILTTNVVVWNDFPPDFVIVPRDSLPDGARRQWGTVYQTNYSELSYRGVKQSHVWEVIKDTNYLMRIVKPLVEITEPVPAVATNTTNF